VKFCAALVAAATLSLLVTERDDGPLWLDPSGRPSGQAREALTLLANAADDGLDSQDYGAAHLQRVAATLDTTAVSLPVSIEFDRQLTAAMAKYLREVHEGRVDPRTLGFRMNVTPDNHDFEAVVRQAVAANRLATTIEDFTPRLALYRNLRHALQQYRAGQAPQLADGVPLSSRIRQIELALERLRWLPHLGEERFIGINIPMFRLWAWDATRPDGKASFQTNVIVGRALNTRTPVFVEQMEHIIFRPYWNVPSSIVRNEILPAMSRQRDYLRRHNMEIVSPPGAPLRIRQRPGATNALGLVKFVFPNDDGVYLHGTPAPALFAHARRDFSHGCVRAQDPVGLAQWVLADRPEWTRERILAAMHGDESLRVDLLRPIRVILFYLTAVVTPEDGIVHFVNDIYGHDARLDRMLRSRHD
jgi:murein L,D-transpeptidase YcbB/YkuD